MNSRLLFSRFTRLPGRIHVKIPKITPFVHSFHSHAKTPYSKKFTLPLVGLLGGLTVWFAQDRMYADKQSVKEFSLEEVAKHNKVDDVWIIVGEKVYDLTEFVEVHPGGSHRLLLAAGGPVEPYWNLYKIHYSTTTPQDILQEYEIGRVRAKDLPKLMELRKKHVEDPFGNDPARHASLNPLSLQPFNAETPRLSLLQQFVTPTDLFFVRGHFGVPDLNPETFKVTVSGRGFPNPVSLSLKDLNALPQHTICVTLQCAGNRRGDMSAESQKTQGLQWGVGAIGTAFFTGPRLTDVLHACGFPRMDEGTAHTLGVHHVHFWGADGFGASIEYVKATDPNADTILALKMNDEPLTRDHGFPLRVIVPGRVAARSVKYLEKIIVSDEESPAEWQRKDYRIPPPYAKPGQFDMELAPPIQELPVQSCITSHVPNQVIQKGEDLKIQGYAVSGARRRIVRVDISLDGGETWTDSKILTATDYLQEFPHHKQALEESAKRGWCWVKFEKTIPYDELVGLKKDGKVELVCKAVNQAWNVQPEKFGPVWNYRGFLANAWHRIPLQVE